MSRPWRVRRMRFPSPLSNHDPAELGEGRAELAGLEFLVVAPLAVQALERGIGGGDVAQLAAPGKEIEQAADRHRGLLGARIVTILAVDAVVDQAGEHGAQILGAKAAGGDLRRDLVERGAQRACLLDRVPATLSRDRAMQAGDGAPRSARV